MGVAPARAAVVEDALAGVEAGRRGGFGLVVGVDRGDQAAALAGGVPTWSSTTWGGSASKAAGATAGWPVNPWTLAYDGFDPRDGAAPGGAVHARQRLLRHPRGRPGGGGR